MPKAKTGCDTVLYTKISPEANKALNTMVKRARETSGWKLSRAVLIDTLIKRNDDANMKIPRPDYKTHEPLPRITRAVK